MLTVEDRFMIKDLYRQGISISEIARRTGHDRKTIRAILQMPLMAKPAARQPKPRKIDAYIPYLEKRMAAGVFNSQKLFQEIQAMGYTGKDRQVRHFLQPYRQAQHRQATMRFETEPGQQAQVDWGAFGTIIHEGRQRRLYAFVMTLGWSRAMYLEFTVSADIAWWLRCHLHAFHYLGGLPQEILHDNLKTAVLSRTADGHIHWHPRYLDFAQYYGFRPRACQPYRAQTKGKVESGIRYLRGNFWPGLSFTDLPDLNQQARLWLDTTANVRRHGTTGEVPFTRLAIEPLQPISGKPDYDTSRITYRRSSKDCLVSYEGNFYSVPIAYAQQQLLLKETESCLLRIFSLEGVELTCHSLATGQQQRIIINAHYAGLTFGSSRKKRPTATQIVGCSLLDQSLLSPQVEVRPLQQYEQWAEVGA